MCCLPPLTHTRYTMSALVNHRNISLSQDIHSL